jgi:hypothetical protein
LTHRQSPGSQPLPSPEPVRAPSLDRHYPASVVLRAPPPAASADAGHHGFIVESNSRSPTSLVAHLPSPTRAAVTTPVESTGAFLARFPNDLGLPQNYGGSTSTLAVSRPARRSLALQPAWTTYPLIGIFSRSASGLLSPLDPPRVFPAGAGVCRPGFAPGRKMHLVKAHATPLPSRRFAPSRWAGRTLCSVVQTAAVTVQLPSTPCWERHVSTVSIPNAGCARC